jgi:hypothetical protein
MYIIAWPLMIFCDFFFNVSKCYFVMCHVHFNFCGFLLNLTIVYDFNELFLFLSLVLLCFFILLSFLFSYTLFVCVCVEHGTIQILCFNMDCQIYPSICCFSPLVELCKRFDILKNCCFCTWFFFGRLILIFDYIID